MKAKPLLRLRRADRESGFTLLEYCAGAAVVLVIVWAALEGLGTRMEGLLEAVGDWATRRTEAIDSTT